MVKFFVFGEGIGRVRRRINRKVSLFLRVDRKELKIGV